MTLRRLLCIVGLHSWVRQPNELQCYGMGLEWFERWDCACGAVRDRLRGDRRSTRVWPAHER